MQGWLDPIWQLRFPCFDLPARHNLNCCDAPKTSIGCILASSKTGPLIHDCQQPQGSGGAEVGQSCGFRCIVSKELRVLSPCKSRPVFGRRLPQEAQSLRLCCCPLRASLPVQVAPLFVQKEVPQGLLSNRLNGPSRARNSGGRCSPQVAQQTRSPPHTKCPRSGNNLE